MKKILLSLILIFLLFPISQGFSQKTDNKPTLAVALTSDAPYVYQDEMGHTIVVGAVKNTNSHTAVTNVTIRALYFDDISTTPLEIVEGHPILGVIPPLGTSPYMIKSNSPNSKITQASVFLETFDSSAPKNKLLTIDHSDVFFDGNLVFSGTIKNGPAPSNNTNIYLAFYDAFQPSRYLAISTISIGQMNPNDIKSFEFNQKINPQTVGFMLLADSDVFYSDMVTVKIPESELLNKMVTISDVKVTDKLGNSLSEVKVGTSAKIQSNALVEYSQDEPKEMAYTYYVQVKEANEPPYVEFIGKYDGRFVDEGAQLQSIDWLPEKKGLYYVETFVWDRDNIPIAEKGPVALILVN